MLMLPIHAAASSQAGRDMRQRARRRLDRREGGSGHDGPRGCVPGLARYGGDDAASPRRQGRAGQGAASDASVCALATPGRATAGEQGMARAGGAAGDGGAAARAGSRRRQGGRAGARAVEGGGAIEGSGAYPDVERGNTRRSWPNTTCRWAQVHGIRRDGYGSGR